MKKFFLISALVCSQLMQLSAQHPLLQSGPMLGYSEMLETLIWVQTTKEAEVYAIYYEQGSRKYARNTNKVITNKAEVFTARLIADSVEPGKRYEYTIYINNKPVQFAYPTVFQTQPIWKWRGNPPNFSLLTGSCAYINQTEHDRPGRPYGGDYRIFSSMNTHQADFMLWLGDNIYLREPDWNSWTGIAARNTHTRSVAELQPFLASTHHYAIWDDHDFGPNDSDKSFFNKDQTLKAFELFWGNPTYGTAEMKGAITSFQWGDADFFLLDNRWYRDPNNIRKDNKTLLGKVQLEWLLDNLSSSTATFKMVALGNQFLSDAAVFELYSNNGFDAERQIIIDFIHEHNIKNVVFVTGDVHFTELSAIKRNNKPSIYDLTFSTLTAGVNTRGGSWNNSYRIPGTVVTERNFGKISFIGESGKRKLIVECYNTDNELKWQYVIDQE